jgi:hypothetical protein
MEIVSFNDGWSGFGNSIKLGILELICVEKQTRGKASELKKNLAWLLNLLN